MEATDQSSLFELSLDHESIDHLTETARWGKFLAIVGFVSCGLIVIMAFAFGAIFSSSILSNLPGYSNQLGSGTFGFLGGAMFAGIYIVLAGVYFFPCLFLYNFSVRLKTALRTNDQVKLNQSLKNQKMLFRYVGIVTIIMVSIYAVALVIIALALGVHPAGELVGRAGRREVNLELMEDTNVQDKPELLEMHLDYDGGNTLREAVRWSKFLSIVGIAGIGLLLVVGLISTPYVMEGYGQLTPDSEGIIGVLLIALALYFSALVAAAIVLLRFSRLTKKGMDHEDQVIFNRGLKSLKITFMILGILSCLSLLGLLFSLIYPI